MKPAQMPRLTLGAMALLLFFALAALPVTSRAAADLSPQAALQQAWELARQSGGYTFSTRLVQTTHPAPAVANVGSTPRVETVYLEGTTDLAADALRMRLWQEGGRLSSPAQAAEVRVESGLAYARQGGSDWQQIEHFTNYIAPGNDFSAFLLAARNVEPVSASNTALTHYTFDLSGVALAEHLRTQLEAQMRRAGKLPPGIQLAAPDAFRNAVGTGEVWLDVQGLPARLSVSLQFPQQANGERVMVEMQTDFSGFKQVVADAALPAALGRLLEKSRQPQVLLSVSVVGLFAFALLHSRSKKLYAAIVVTVIFSMTLTPLLHSAQVYAFQHEQAELQAAHEQDQAIQTAAAELQTELDGKPWNPHVGPTVQNAVIAASTTSDDDGDGLSNEDDPCPDSADCDGDGLSDLHEIRLGTNPEEKDTDGDYITDNAEVAGFWFNSQWWYSNPANPDTNNDGIPDGAECPAKAVDEGELSAEDNACEDIDADGEPDLFDRDNDGDGAPDRVDLSPGRAVFQGGGDPFDGQHPLQIQVDSLQSGVPAFLDFQLRPQNAEHLWYALNVLDWPSGDEQGQVMRRTGNDSTYADLGDPAANAANGDMRLIPMLEIEIPYQQGHYANLPVLEGAPPRTPETALDDWLDRAALADYGIAVRPANDDGDLMVYVPLNLIQDETSGDRVAFGGRMMYLPMNTITDTMNADWGSTQQVRVVWLVQMLTDTICSPAQADAGECTAGEWVTDIPQVVRGYDETWYLTGLSLREDHGLEVAIAYEDPAQEPSDEARTYDDWLWALAHGLDAAFLTGRDQDGDGTRDLNIGEIRARFDNRVNGGTSDEERWGIPITATQVITFAYDHEDYFVHLMLTETQKILDEHFSNYREQGSDAPTLLFAQEAQYRSVNLADESYTPQDGNLLRVNVDPEASPQTSRAFLSWAPYRYNEADSRWENYPLDEYLDKMEVRLKDAFDQYQDDPDYENILRGQILLAQAHYLALYAGAMQVVQLGDTLTGNYGEENRDDAMADWISGAEIDKAGGVMARQAYSFANLLAKISKYYKNVDQIFKDLGVPSQGGFKATIKELWQNTSWKKLKLGAAMVGAVVAIGVLTAVLALYGSGNSRAAAIVLDVVTLKMAVLDALYTTRSAIKLIKASETAGKYAKIKDAMHTKGMKYSGKAFAIGVIVAAVVMLAVFLIAWGASGERWDSLAFTLGLASVLSSIITMVILLAIAAIPIVGEIVAAVIFLLDAIFQLVCHAQNRADDDFFCQGISGYVAQGVRWAIFSQNIMVKLPEDEFLQITDFAQEFKNIEAGMSQGNALIVTLDTRHQIQTLPASEISGWMPWLYRWQYNENNTRSTTFNPALATSGQSQPAERGSIRDAWQENGSTFTYETADSLEIPLNRAGINQPAQLYLNDGLALPAQECWLIPNPLFWATGVPVIPVCYVRTHRDTLNIDLGKNLRYDVFPATLDDFMALTAKEGGHALAWSQDTSPAFPRLQDADGDGLRAKAAGGADPNDLLWDSDSDSLSDFFELQFGSNPLDSDSDDDGLTDAQESRLETNPNLADSDYDGLTDQEEIAGWEFVYDFAADGSQLATWVTSDPTRIDGDGDGFSDFQEKTYGFHPQVPSDPNILTLASRVSEPLAPQVLLRLDESLSASAFRDDSGNVNNAACFAVHCPVAGHYGQYGNAPHFDGTDDYLEISHNDSLTPQTELTLAAWLYLANPAAEQKVIGKTTIGNGFVLGVGNGQLYPEIWDANGTRYTAHWGSIPAETWVHVAITWQSGGQMVGYLNGEVVGALAASPHPIGGNQNPLRIGIAPWNAAAWPLEGFADEALLFTRALSQSEIQAYAAGRYNPDDLTVQSGDELFYQATVTNELFNRYAQGLLGTRFPAAFSDLPPQDFVLNPRENTALSGMVTVGSAPSGVYTLTQEADALITDWREDSGYAEARYRFSDADTLLDDSSGSQPPRHGECSAPHCPSLAAGRYGNAAEFDGVDDYITADAVAEALADSPALTFGGWVYPQSGMSQNGVMISFHTAGGGNLLMLEYAPTAQKFIAYDRQSGDVFSTNTFPPDQWYHVMFVIYEGSSNNAYLYVNGNQEAQFSSPSRPTADGRFSLGQEWDRSTASNFFRGRLDEISLYPRALSQDEVQRLFGNPIFHLAFEEGAGATTFEDDSGLGNAATCSGDSCPQSGITGISGNALRFEGAQSLSIPQSSALDLSGSDFTLAAWVYPEGSPPLSDCPFRAEYFSNTSLARETDTRRRCEGYPLNHNWGSGEPISGIPANYFSARWEGTFFFAGGEHTFTFVTDDGMRAWVDGDQILDEWHTQSATTYEVDYTLNAGWHTVKVEYFEQSGDARAQVSWNPDPLPHPQAILGAPNYPTLLRAGNHLALALNPDTLFATAEPVLAANAWNHVAASFDGETVFLYVDGEEVAQFAAGGQSPAGGQTFEIGRAAQNARLQLQNLHILQANQGAFVGNPRVRVEISTDNGTWQNVWEDNVSHNEYIALNVQRTYQQDARVRLSRVEMGSSAAMGSETLQMFDPSPNELVTRYENSKTKTDLLWFSQVDSTPFTGRLDEVALYKTALSSAQVTDLYEAVTLALRLPLDDAPGAREFADALGQHNGACSGAACPTAGVNGRDEMGLRFDGVDDYVTINDAGTADLNSLTLAAWVRLESTPTGIMRFVTVGNEKAVLRYDDDPNGNWHFYLKTSDGAFHHLRFGSSIQTGVWYHLAGTYDGSQMRLYLNGAEVASQPVSGALTGGDTIRLSHPVETLDGTLDEIRLYRRALSANEIAAQTNAVPEMLLLLDEESQTTTFGDATGNGHTATCSGTACPKAGAKGQMGLAPQWDGTNDYLKVSHTAALNPTEALTLILWVKLEDTDPNQKLAGKSSNDIGYVLGIKDGQLYPEVWDNNRTHYAAQWGQITAGYWTQLAFTWQTGGDMVGYINGQEVGRIPASGTGINRNNFSQLLVGIAPWNITQFPANGRLDHVTLYSRALTPLEILRKFRLQAKWVEDRQKTEITLDNDSPQSVLRSDEMYRPNQDVVLLVESGDPTSFVTLLEMGISTDGGGSYTWKSAPPCEDARGGTAWCPTFEPSMGEGRYLLQFRATDVAGNRETPSTVYTVLVDDTPPQTATAIPQGQLLRPALQPDHTWLLLLNGTVTDPQVDGSPGSGAAEVRVKLTDTDPISDTLPLLVADLNGGNWQVQYPLLEADATGTYTLSVQASDTVGNGSELHALITLGTDTAPPQASLNDLTAQTGVTGTITATLQLSGIISETGSQQIGLFGMQVSILPAAQEAISGTVAVFHLDEPAGATRFVSRGGSDWATCTVANCPTAGEAGIWGTGLRFSENEQQSIEVVTLPAAITDTHGYAFGGWVYPTRSVVGVMIFEDASGSPRSQIRYSGKFVYTDPVRGNVWGSPLPEGNWYHVLVSVDEAGNGVLYVNGQADATFNTSVRPDPAGGFHIGYGWMDGRDYFDGYLDEVRVFDRALAPNEVYSLYAAAQLSAAGAGIGTTDWTYSLPATFDGLYQINLRPGDLYSNTAPADVWAVWNGQIDTRPPEASLQIEERSEEIGGAGGFPLFNVETSYTCWARDFNLVAQSPQDLGLNFECPCGQVAPASTTVRRVFYHEVSPWYAEVFTDTARLYEYTETCTVPGLQTVPNYLRACDAYGHCTETQDPDPVELIDEIDVVYGVTLTPTHQTILTSVAPITIEGKAYARDFVDIVTVYLDGVPIGVPVDLPCPSGVSSVNWSLPWLPTEGNHTLHSVVRSCVGETFVEPGVNVIVDTIPPTAGIFPAQINRDQRLSYGRVRLGGAAVDAASGLDLVQVRVNGGEWAQAAFDAGSWQWDWYLGEEPDNASYNVTVRATDRAGWTAETSQLVTVDLDAPNPVTLTLTSDVTAGSVVTPGLTLRQIPATFTLSWQASEPNAALSHYQVLWVVETTAQTLQIPVIVPPSGPLSAQYVASEAQKVQAQVTSVFLDGNTQTDRWGAVYVDTPLTPDYLSMQSAEFAGIYNGWLESGCTNLGVDRRVAENAPDGVTLGNPQHLYASWDRAGLRLAWVGANWNYDGDLFIYLNDFSDPSVPLTAYNPFSQTQQTTLNIPGGRAFIWVQDSQTAQLFLWNGNTFGYLDLHPTHYRFIPGLDGGITHLYIPFDLIGIANPEITPLSLFAFATEEGQMRLWATQPAQNPLNSPNVVATDLYAGAQQSLEWLHVYTWAALAPGICPNAPAGFDWYQDTDLRFEIETQPEGSAYGLLSSDLFWLADELTAITRTADLSQHFAFMDVSHPPVGHGDLLTYTLRYANQGTYTATGVTLRAAGLFGLQLSGEVSETITLTVGTIPPGASGSLTFTGLVDVNTPYNNCLAQTGGDTAACQPYRQWAVLNITPYDDAHPNGTIPLDWLWVDHAIDHEPPQFFGILTPQAYIQQGENNLEGYAFDPSGVAALTLEVQPPSGGSYQLQCPDAAPFDGTWQCLWDAGSAADGAVFQIRLRAEDGYGHLSDWSAPYIFTVDATAPQINLSAATQAYTSTIVQTGAASFSGGAADGESLGGVTVCFDAACQQATLTYETAPLPQFSDVAAAPLPIGACGGGEVARTFTVTETFTLGGVALGLNLAHPQRADLWATLTSPAGTIVQVLIPPDGTPPAYANLDVTLADSHFSHASAYPGNDEPAEPYFERLAQPAAPFDALRGENAAGVWTLTLCDAANNAYEGTYNRAQLTLKPPLLPVLQAGWGFLQTGLEGQDYLSHTLQVYATDLAGNQSDGVTLTVWVDNVAPEMLPTQMLDTLEFAGGAAPEEAAPPRVLLGASPRWVRVMQGTTADGGAIRSDYAMLLTPGGDRQSVQIGRAGDAWWLDLWIAEVGDYTFWINVVDAAGNANSAGPFSVRAVRALAESDSPTPLGAATTLTATLLGEDAAAYQFGWDFGDGTSASDSPPVVSHLYLAAGAYTVTLTALADSQAFTATTRVVVAEAISGLTASSNSPVFYGSAITLTATIATGSEVQYAWDFGDGQPSAQAGMPLAIHNYPPGVFTATITAQNAVSVLTATVPIQVIDLQAANNSPTNAGQSTIFTATLAGAESTAYTWDFGDASPVVVSSLATVTHTYSLPGAYTATVMVETPVGALTATTAVTVNGLGVINSSPTALGSPTAFTATASLSGTLQFDWGFGDGILLTDGGAWVTHTYPAAGVYTAALTVTNGSQTLTATTRVVIDGQPPEVAISDPLDGQIIQTTVYTLRGSASDDIGLARVETSTDGGQTWQLTSGGEAWQWVWQVPAADGEMYTLLARAVDLAGQITLSEPVTVLVRNLPRYKLYLPIVMR